MIGLGELGLSPAELYEYTLQEFYWKIDRTRKIANMNYREGWEQTREIVYMIGQMAGNKELKKGVTKYQLMKFSWDKVKENKSITQMTPEERKVHMEAMIENANTAWRNLLNKN